MFYIMSIQPNLVCGLARNWTFNASICISAPQSKNAVSTNINHSRYIHLMANFSSIHFHLKRLYVHTFCIVDTPFGYGRGLIVCSSFQEISQDKGKYSACDRKCRYCVFTLWGRTVVVWLWSSSALDHTSVEWIWAVRQTYGIIHYMQGLCSIFSLSLYCFAQVSVENPWDSPKAAYLDSISVEDWAQKHVWTR